MRPSRLFLSALLVAIILAAGAFTVFAAPSLQRAQAAAKPKTATPANGAKAQQYCDSFLKDFAGKLGVDPKKVVPALRDSIKDGIDQAVTNGDLTAEQSTKFKTKVDGVQGCADLAKMGDLVPSAKRPHGAAAMGAPRLMEVVTAAAATALKVPPADLQKDVVAGDSLSKIAATTGVDKPAFDAAFRTALTTQLDADVAAKKMTQAQETEMVDQAVKMADKLWDTSLSSLGGGLFGHAGRKPLPPGAPPAPPPPPVQ